MSKICIGVLCDSKWTPDLLDVQLMPLLCRYELKMNYGLTYHEPLLDQYEHRQYMVFSVSDSEVFDNCDFFLLADNCLLNGRSNEVLFSRRMLQLEMILEEILTKDSIIDLFIGDSGGSFNEFEEQHICAHEFGKASKCLNTLNPPDIHFVVRK